MDFKVSVVVPAYNEEKNIERCLRSILKQDYRWLEIIVVDDGSTDRTSEIAKSFGSIKVIKNKRNLGLAKSLNKGIKASKGNIVITLHADCKLVGRNWISKIIKPFKDAKVAGVTGNPILHCERKLSLFDKVNLYFVGAYASTKSKRIANRDLLNNKCDAYRKKYLEEVGLFDEKFKISGEDIDLTCKLRKKGYKLLIHPKCYVRIYLSSHQNTFVKSLKKRITYGRMIPYLILNHFSELMRNKTWLMRTVPYVLYFIFVVMSFFNHWFLFFVFFLNLLLSIRIYKILGISAFLLSFFLIPIYTIIWNIGIIYGVFIINMDRI